MPYNPDQQAPAEPPEPSVQTEGYTSEPLPTGSAVSYGPMPDDTLANMLKSQEAVVLRHTEQISRLIGDLASIQREPGPYADLNKRLADLESDRDILKRIMASLEVLQDRQTTPEVIIKHWRDEQGTWHYETTIKLKPEEITALPNTLGWVDETSRVEAKRRERLDADDRAAKALGKAGPSYG